MKSVAKNSPGGRQAQEMVELVSDLMRQTLEAADDDFVTLEWELAKP